MPTFRLSDSTTGKTYRITMPEGSTADDAYGQLQQHVQHQANVEAQQAKDRELYDPTAGMSWWEKAAANVGAGASNLIQGAQQLAGKVGIGPGVSDEEIQEKRDIDEHLARQTTGGKLLQAAGETLPTMIPGLGVVSRFPMAMRLGTASRAALAGGLGAAGAAAVSPTKEDESRGVNMAAAGVLGAALPGAGQLAGKAAQEGWRIFSRTGAGKRAAQAIAEKFEGGAAEAAARAARGAQGQAPIDLRGRSYEIPSSAAQATGTPEFADIEAYLRSNPTTRADWQGFDAARNAALHDATQGMAPSDLRMARLEAVRTGRTAPMREQALQTAGQTGNFAEPVVQHAQDLLEGASGANPSVQSIANYVQRTLGPDAVGAVSPERLYEVRKVLAGKLQTRGIIGDELSAAAKGAQRETMGVIQAIDQSLDQATGGQWTPYLREYAERSQPITSGRAMRQVADTMSGKPLVGTSELATPQVTAHGYGGTGTPTQPAGALKATVGPYGSRLTPEDQQATQQLLAALRQGEAAARSRKLSSTMGGGSITNTDQWLAAGMKNILDRIPMIGGATRAVGQLNREQVDREMSRLMQNPQALAEALRNLPPGRPRQLLIDAMRETQTAAGASVGAAAVQR